MNALRLVPVLFLALPLVAAAQFEPGSTAAQNAAAPGAPRPGPDASANGAGGPDAQAMRDRIFLRKAAQGGMAEVQLSQLAAQKSESEDVRKLAQKLVEDHTALNASLRPFAEQLGILPARAPNKMDTLDFDRLTSLSGADFDREYLALMAQDHHRDLRDFREEAVVTTDNELRDAVSHGQTVIAEHMRRVDKLAAAHGVTHP